MSQLITDLLDPRAGLDWSDLDPHEPINRECPWNRGLVSFWPGISGLNDGGLVLHDVAGQYHGTLTNSPGWMRGNLPSSPFGGLSFADANEYASFGDVSAFAGLTQFTLGAFILTRVMSGGTFSLRYIFSKEATSGGFGTTAFILRLNTATSALEFYIGDSGNYRGPAAATIDTFEWYSVTARYDASLASGSQLAIAINGHIVGTATGAGLATSNTTADASIGAPPTDVNRDWDGGIADPFFCNRALSDAEILHRHRDALRGYEHTFNWRTKLTLNVGWPDAGGGGGHTATSTLTISSQTLSASAEHDTPVYTGDSALTINNQTLDADATHTPPTSEGTGDLNVSNQTLDGSGTHTTPVYEGGGDLNVTNQELASSASHTTPVYEGTASLTVTNQTLAASGTFATQLFSGTSDLTVSNQQLAASATFDEGTFTGDGTLVVSNQLLAASGTFTAPVYEGTSALTVSNQTLAADALFAAEIYLGEAALQIGQQVLSGSATYTFPTYSGEGTLQASQQTLAAAAQVTNPVYTGDSALLLGSLTLAADAIYADDLFTGEGSLSITNMVLSAEAVFTGITLEFRERLIVNVDDSRLVINSKAPTRLVVDLER